MKWYEFLLRSAAVVAFGVVLGFAQRHVGGSRNDPLGSRVYQNLKLVEILCTQQQLDYRDIQPVNRLGPVYRAPCTRPAGFTDKFRIFPFLIALVIAMGVAFSKSYPRTYEKDDPIFGRFNEPTKSQLVIWPISPWQAILFSVICWLMGIPMNFYLLRAPFNEYVNLCLFIAVLGYLTAIGLAILSMLVNVLAIRSTRSRSAFNADLTGLAASRVVDVVGVPLKVVKVEAKTIYVYKNIKVILTDGKVTDVQ